MDLNLKDKVIIVTGGAKGIGEAITRSVSKENGVAVIVGRSKEVGEQVAEDIKDQGGKALAIHKNLGTPVSCSEVIDEVMQEYGRIDGLVNNAGANDGVGLEKGGPDAFLASLEKNLYHYYYLAHYALDALKASKGSIVNISSKTAVTGQGNTSAYAAAKGAQLALTREWAVELLKHQIRVNAILPAEVMTPLYESWINTFSDPKAKLNEIERKIPLGNRMTTSEEIANMAVFLLSDRAAHMTGQHLYVDGGYVHLDRALAGAKE
ncbi:SDR family oxidoreductase [Fulvivirgaceae bacterium BMA10]|uniref:SDR family oxidoreductase n=1 Tax=Splendidivirga corallicola TaxID=3051826 RepID=A0ABT8KX96_9BACT|nr:SDR family oxidoreductase [Fulvivirgaceae bacterium BMA10]